MNKQNQNALFYEEQYFRQTWIWVGLLPASLLMLVIFGIGLYQQFYLGKSFGNNPMSDTALVVVATIAGLFAVGMPFLFYKMKLSVQLDTHHLLIRFSPFVQKRFLLSDIARWEARTYHPIREYGGWGIRYAGRKRGWAYNVNGNRGVQLELTNGKHLLIGSQCPEELAAAIMQAKHA